MAYESFLSLHQLNFIRFLRFFDSALYIKCLFALAIPLLLSYIFP